MNGFSSVAARLRSPLWFAGLAVAAAVVLYPSARDLVLDVEVTPAERGRQVAMRAGCFTCHGANGNGGVKNPGSADGEVPGFAAGTPMMWAKSENELRDYILDGAPARKRNDPRHRERMQVQLLTMPAYRGLLGNADVDALIVYLRAASGLVVPADAQAAQGQELAYRLECFNCHGPMGAGGIGNLGSLKGYIPGWWGKDFRDLVRDDEELRTWIADGRIPRLENHPVAKYFTRWQRVKMPAYRPFITDAELQALVRYLRWVNAGNWQRMPLDLGH